MAKQTINIGTAPNDGTGTPARDAFDICNDNFTELYDGKLALDGSTEMTGDLVFAEAADHSSTPAAGKGYLWVKSDTPSSLIFTDDAGTDYDLTDITSTPEGTAILSTGEVGGTKFLREDGDGTSSWQAIPAPEGTSVLSTGPVTDGYVLTADGAGGAAWEAAAGGGAFSADAQTQITPTTPIVLDEATGDEVALDLSYTVNKAAGNDTGLLINQTDTASPGTSLLADFQVGGNSRFRVTNDGDIIFTDHPSINRGKIALASGYSGFWLEAGSTAVAAITGAASAGLMINPTLPISWSSSANLNVGVADLTLYRDAANTLALRNSTNAQTFNVYGTYTDSSNYERLAITGSAITVQTAGTGTDDIDLTLTPAGAGNVKFGTHSAIGAETVTGYITIKDSSGTTRKLAVVS